MDSPNLLSFFDELEKLGAIPVGNQANQEERVPAKPPTPGARLMSGFMGGAVLADQAPVLARKLQGRGTFYHGTTSSGAAGITSPTSVGIDPSFAGAGVMSSNRALGERAARFNRYGLANSLGRLLESGGVPLTHEQLSSLTERFNHLMDQEKVKAAPAAQRIFSDATRELVEAGKMTPEVAQGLHQQLMPDLSRFGHRSYFTTHPVTALPWSSTHSEGELAGIEQRKMMEGSAGGELAGIEQRKLMEGAAREEPSLARNLGRIGKAQLRATIEGLTFGWPTTVENTINKLKYHPTEEAEMTLPELHEHLKGVSAADKARIENYKSLADEHGKWKFLRNSPEMRKYYEDSFNDFVPSGRQEWEAAVAKHPQLKSLVTGEGLEDLERAIAPANKEPTRVIFGLKAPTAQMGYLEDFPILRQFMAVNPGVKPALRMAGLHTYEPGTDISFPHAVPKEHLTHADVVDPITNKIKRIKIKGAVTPEASPFFKRFGRGMAMPAAMTALGGYGIYRAFNPKKRMVRKGSPRAMVPEEPKGVPPAPSKEKRGSALSDMWDVGRYAIPLGVTGGALGYGTSRLMDKLIPTRPEDSPAKASVKSHTRLNIGSQLASYGGAGLGALAGIPLLKRTGIPIGHRMVGGGILGSVGIGIPAAAAMAGTEQMKEPESDIFISPLPDRAVEYFRERPWLGAVKNTALMMGLPAAAVYGFRKFYPGTASTGIMKVKNELARLAVK